MIEVGEHVRTSKGEIFKVAEVVPTLGKETAIVKKENGQPRRIDLQKEKHSKNIIDLIEVGDIVHTRDVLNEDITYIWSKEYLDALKEDLKNGIELVDILTFEQYTRNCYTVERKKEC